MLQSEDLVFFLWMEPEGGIIAPGPKAVAARGTIGRLTAAGFLADSGMTEKGKETHSRLVKTVNTLKAGVDVTKRVKTDVAKATDPKCTVMGWVTGTHAKKPYITNGAVFILGKPSKEMNAVEAPADLRMKVSALLNTHTSGKLDDYLEVKPYAYQISDLGGMEFIWLRSVEMSLGIDEKEDLLMGALMVPIQAMFVDLIRDRYPSTTFWVKPKRYLAGNLSDHVVVARVTNRGIKNNVVALVIAVAGAPTPPVLEGGDSGDVH